ncbi:SIR2 family protein [Burkholderia sp. Ed8]|uniref:SIR2 family NAD-dependent protein deacylase n=1 Tax=Burkholderia sp. Ed8 TaxID=3112957 RepID=UPI00345CFD84
MATTTKLTELHDYPAVKKLASALHRLDAHHHGAAIMIGAGFSRSAAVHVSGEKRVPLWAEFTTSLTRDLYAGETNLSFADPLRVAEEYRAYFGQGALNDKIRFEIDNDAWRTGPLYDALLTLPWSEVLTTNWDTLLEQAAEKVHSPYYTTVTKTSDLAWAQSPRIVKLHGTIGITDSFIAAQEDYRTYPARFAPFVNLARQVFIENELCLLGFSGDDPNFLQWAGWVRDHLAGHARKIYLVGALNLSAARRKQLESTNIAPVDLYPAVAHITDRELRHQEAIAMFLREMKSADESRIKPHDWQPTSFPAHTANPGEQNRAYSDPEYAATLLTSQLETLRKDREAYPGWLLCPESLRWRVANQLSMPFPNAENLAALTPDNRAKLLYEIAWRHRTALEYMRPWLVEALFEVARQNQPCAISERQQAEIALALLHNARWLCPDNDEEQKAVDEHIQELIAILKTQVFYFPDGAAEIAYHHALAARDRLDYDELAAAIDQISGEDPVWKLRKAALLMDLGREGDAADLVAVAYGQLRENHRRGRQSIPVMSRLLWAHWLMEALQRGSSGNDSEKLPPFVEANYRKWKCDPWSWLDSLRSSIEKRRDRYLKNRSPIEPQFKQGHYRVHSRNTSNGIDNSDFLLLDGLSRICGVPFRITTRGFNVSLLSDKAKAIVLYGGTGAELFDLPIAIRSASSEDSSAVRDVFGRINVACFTQRSVDILIPRVMSAVKHWQQVRSTAQQDVDSLTRLRVLVEVLARLVVRVPPSQAKEIFALAASLADRPEMRHIWLRSALDSLVNNSLSSIPESELPDVLNLALKFPLAHEIEERNGPEWPNPVIKYSGERLASPIIDERIAQLIDAVRADRDSSRRDSLLRLLPLSRKKNFLTEAERNNLSDAVWGDAPAYTALPETGLLPHALLILPTRDPSRVEALLRSQLYDHNPDVLADTQKELRKYPSPEVNLAISAYEGMTSAAEDQATQLFPTAEQAVTLFERLTAWRPVSEQGGMADIAARARRELAKSIGHALSFSIVPALTYEDKTTSRWERLRSFYSEVDGARTALPALVHFAVTDALSASTVEKMIASALRGRDATQVTYAAIALRKWMDLTNSETSPEFMKLTSIAIGMIESGRTIALHQLLWLAKELFVERRLTEDQCRTLAEVIPDVFRSVDYRNVDPHSEEAVTASIIRSACIKLALVLTQRFPDYRELADLLDSSAADPLPEVRFASNSP